MRPTICLILLAACLFFRGLSAGTPAMLRAAETPTAAKGGPWSVTLLALGPTQAEARRAVRDKAQQRVASYLFQREPGLRWVPSAEELDRWITVEEPSAPKLDNTEWGGALFKAQLRVEVSDKDVEEILAVDQRERVREGQQLVRERQILSLKVLAGLVALLAAVAGYFRLEELTRGYYTGVLRGLLLLCLGVVGAGLWLLL
jgi:hypothetical protein